MKTKSIGSILAILAVFIVFMVRSPWFFRGCIATDCKSQCAKARRSCVETGDPYLLSCSAQEANCNRGCASDNRAKERQIRDRSNFQ